ncbi:MAG TPA: hypothetical protein PK079_05980 [Leptospiraceae bacterium]|nr:hypothetical protein [Leptospiraceae bacterium]HMX32507.1 hypothetical protein [Leptospiraceae bacterium]HMY30241.1 hypothetical protein [Leptospiraceae bacterium]HMZ67250.1 hypothetical protein [Leptospiraceae bacterium]HNA07180.1 hypothetical protein [Leptospiraceae bacterium]
MILRILALILLLLIIPSYANEKSQLIIKDFFDTVVNWSTMQISLNASEKLPRVIIDVDDPEYGKENTAYNISEARNKSLLTAKEKTKIHFVRSIESIRLNEEYTIIEKVNKDEKFRERFNEFFLNESSEIKVKYIQDEVRVESLTKLLGSKGLMNYLMINYDTEKFPEFMEIPVPEAYTGLIIDARHLDANPALFPRIFTDKGLEIYSMSLVNKNFAIDNGFVIYMSDPIKAMKHQRVGENPYLVVATNVIGKNKTGYTIPTKEATKILATKETKKNLKKCKVIIVLRRQLS